MSKINVESNKTLQFLGFAMMASAALITAVSGYRLFMLGTRVSTIATICVAAIAACILVVVTLHLFRQSFWLIVALALPATICLKLIAFQQGPGWTTLVDALTPAYLGIASVICSRPKRLAHRKESD